MKDINHDAARQLAELVISLDMITPAGKYAKHLARLTLGILNPEHNNVAITTNGTTRYIPRDEPLFLLRGQDILAPYAVKKWAELATAHNIDPERVRLANETAAAMEAWSPRKMPD